VDRCPKCKNRMITMLGESGRTEFKCRECDHVDPLQTDMVKWTESLSPKAA
jgi:DNA-directed RNA polymerase subunit M/transcription elongation factor TFIIS